MILPSLDGFRPTPESEIAFSSSFIVEGSNGWTVSSRASGALIVASERSGVATPK